MTLLFADGTEFTTGICECNSRPATEGERLTRLFVPIIVEGFRTDAVIDTGGAYLILDPEIAAELEIDPVNGLSAETLTVRGNTFRGFLHRLALEFPASSGTGVSVDVTAFVPILDPDDAWPLPTYLGWHGCLERLRFAVDPFIEQFYFGVAG